MRAFLMIALLFAVLSCAAPASSFTPPNPSFGPAARSSSPPHRTAAQLTWTPTSTPRVVTTTSTPVSPLFGMFSSDDESARGVQPPAMTDEQKEALRSFAETAVDVHGFSWFRRSDCLDDCRSKYPVLSDFTDDELAAAHLSQKPQLLDVFVKTPLGAFLGINLVLWAADFSWCDTPFGNPSACPPGP